MSCSFGNKLKITLFGQSHSCAIGVVVDGLPAGEVIDMDEVQRFMNRRAPGKNSISTKRTEADIPQIMSGIVNGKTCGAPLCAVIQNTDCRSNDYNEHTVKPRPAHADFAAWVKHGGFNDIRGGGNFSGRLTAPLVFAGAVCKQILFNRGVEVFAHILSVGDIYDERFDLAEPYMNIVKSDELPVINAQIGEKMRELIEGAGRQGDSVGGKIECAVTGVPAGIGEPIFGGVENHISSIVFGIPAVKGIEFGLGFAASELRGSQNNDEFYISNGEVKTRTNNHGGILGGITSGMPIVFTCAIKPTPSIGMEQNTVDLEKKIETKTTVKGRHDPCIVPRAVPCVEAAAAVAVLDLILDN